MPSRLFSVFLCSILLREAALAETPIQPQKQVLPAETTLRVQSFARERHIVKNPLNQAQILYRIPEGSRVKEGDLLFVFDMSAPEEAMVTQQQSLDATSFRIRKSRANRDDELRTLTEKIEEVEDEIALLEARMAYLRSLPRAEDVEIVAGRLQVAAHNLDASRLELERAKDRNQRGLLSAVGLAAAERDVRRKEALYAYAKDELDYAKLPATRRSIRILELKLENQNIEHARRSEELKKKQHILEIEEEGSDADLKREQDKLEEQREDLEHEYFHSPTNGVVIYTTRFKRMIAGGTRGYKSTPLLELASENSMAFRGAIAEKFRPWFDKGDPIELVLNSHPDLPLRGSVQSISPLPRDAADGEYTHYGEEDKVTGVKVYDLEIDVPDLPPALRIGTYGWATLRAAHAEPVLTVPADYLRMIDGLPHLARDGVFAEVKGRVHSHQFIIDQPGWETASITRSGELPRQEAETTNLLFEATTDQLVATGELYPGENIKIQSPRNQGWDMKIAFLAPEDQYVKKGELIIQLESERLSQQEKDLSSSTKVAESKRQAAETRLAIAKQESGFELEAARNLLEIRKLEWEIAESGMDAMGFFQARLNLSRAELDLEAAIELRDRGARNPESIAETELQRREREVKRKQLARRAAEIRLEDVRKGNDDIRIRKAKLDYLKQKTSLARLEQQSRSKVNQAAFALDFAKRSEDRGKRKAEKNTNALDACRVLAPADGLVKYEKLWDGTGISKIGLGRSAWPGAHLMSLSDATDMSVKLEVPERAYRHLRIGLPVEVRIPSLSSNVLQGRVQQIGSVLTPLEEATVRSGLYANHEPTRDQVVPLRVAIDGSESLNLKPGAIAHVIFPFPDL